MRRSNHRPKIFLSSAFGPLRREREFAVYVIEEMGFDAEAYPEGSSSGSPGGEFIDRLRACHVLVHIATGRQESEAVQRELREAEFHGLPILTLVLDGRHRGTRSWRFERSFDTLEELRSALRDGLAEVVLRRFSAPQSLERLGGNDIYERAAQACRSASFRLGMVQETATLLLGHRRDRRAERGFLDELHELILASARGSRDVRIIYLFDGPQTAQAAGDIDRYPAAEGARDWLQEWRSVIQPSERIQLVSVSGSLSASVVHDASIEVATVLHDRYYVWLTEAGGVANGLWDHLEVLASEGTPIWDDLPKSDA